jgi:hypothetical protein
MALGDVIGYDHPDLDQRVPSIAYDDSLDPEVRIGELEGLYADANPMTRGAIHGYTEMLCMLIDAREHAA